MIYNMSESEVELQDAEQKLADVESRTNANAANSKKNDQYNNLAQKYCSLNYPKLSGLDKKIIFYHHIARELAINIYKNDTGI